MALEQAIFWFAVSAVTTGIAQLATAGRRRARVSGWRTAAERAGLTIAKESTGNVFTPAELIGHSSPLGVRLTVQREGRRHRSTLIVVSGLGHGSGGLTLRPEGFLRRALDSEIEIGAPAFDDQLHIKGDLALALAVFDAKTRRQAAALLRGAFTVEGHEDLEIGGLLTDGLLAVRVKEKDRDPNGRQLSAALAAVLDFARRLVAPPDIARRIAENLRREPAEGVRLRSVEVLANELPDHPATRAALLAACKDPSDEVRLRAALVLSDEGDETLLGLVASPGTEDSCAARAIEALDRRLPRETAEEALQRALQRQRGETAAACLDALGRLGGEESLILQGLASGDPQVVLAAIRALGQVGTAAAVPALRKVEAEAHSGLRGAAHQAIATIQSRLAGAARGQLSLTGGATGALSLAAAEPGQLSFGPEESEAFEMLPLADSVPDEPASGSKGPPPAATESA